SHFWTRLPQPVHQLTILISHTPIPKAFPNIHPFPSHTYSIYNHKPQPLSVKYHFPTQQPIQNYTHHQPPKILPIHTHSSHTHLYNPIQNPHYPKSKIYIQLITHQQSKNHPDNP
ncbi:catalase, partial [Staphylococcus epidermidis]|uniref:catalase n=1 Tax=Staphylococcus epidermidis TaxID=1282 RepID=UPI0011A4136B